MSITKLFSPKEEILNSLSYKDQKKVFTLISSGLIFSIAFTMFSIVLIVTGALRTGILTIPTVFFSIISLVMIKKGKMGAASYLTTAGTLYACFIVAMFSSHQSHDLVQYRTACFCNALALVNALTSFTYLQINLFHIVTQAFLICSPFLIYMDEFKANPKSWIASTIITVLAMAGANAMLLFIKKNNEYLIQRAEKEHDLVSENFSKIKSVISQTKESLNISAKLNESSRKAFDSSSRINTLYQNLLEVANGLKEQTNAIKNASVSVNQQAEAMGKNVEDQNNSLTNTSATITEISSNISNINEIAEKRRDSMSKVAEILDNQNNLIKTLVDEVSRVQDSSKKIAAFVETVDSIAGQTSLLAMNASIEAAHAGTMGKGFSVIAQEIRKLSNETTKNANQISDTLKENTEVVHDTALSVEQFAKTTEESSFEIKETISSMEEILRGINEMDIATRGAREEISSVVEGARNNASTIKDVITQIADQTESLSSISTSTDSLQTNVDSINEILQMITDAIGDVNDISKENEEVSTKLVKLLD